MERGNGARQRLTLAYAGIRLVMNDRVREEEQSSLSGRAHLSRRQERGAGE